MEHQGLRGVETRTMTNIFEDAENILAPIILDDGEASGFVRDRVCAGCLGYLFLRPMQDRKWKVICQKCGDIIKGGHIHISEAEKAEHRTLEGLRELRPETPPRPAAEILAELGF
jgi:hypothetical protein